MEEEVFTGKLDWKLWRKTATFAKPYRKHIALLISIGALVSLLDTALPWLTRNMIDAITRSDSTGLRLQLYAYAAVVIVFVLCINAFILTAGWIATGIGYDVRKAAFAKLQDLPFAFYDRKAVGWLMARMTGDCATLSRVMGWALLDLSWGPCVLTAVTIMMFRLNWRLALLVVALTPILLLTARFFQRRILLTSRALRKANSQTTASFNESIVGVRTSKSMVREERNLEEFRTLADSMYNHALKNALYSALFIPLMLSICSIGTALVLWRGGLLVGPFGMSLGTLVAFVQYAGFLQFPVTEICNMLTQVQGAQASAERIATLLDADVEIQDSPEVRTAVAAHTASITATPTSKNLASDGKSTRIDSLEFRNVSFTYKAGRSVLQNFNLKVHAGQTIALVGPTGGGKTTIVGLACRFYEPTAGTILLSGIDYRERPLHWLQSNLGMVLQQPHLFSGTVRENIRYGRLSATDAEIEAAARLVNAHDFITTLKQGYDTPVGEGGSQLSSGQKQLVSLARAVLADPQIFIMDEATSSVDTQTERAIQSAIERVLKNRISFVIAHRLSTIKHADRILLIDQGRILEDGTHHDLIRLRGQYYDLYTNQFTHEREEALLEQEPRP